MRFYSFFKVIGLANVDCLPVLHQNGLKWLLPPSVSKWSRQVPQEGRLLWTELTFCVPHLRNCDSSVGSEMKLPTASVLGELARRACTKNPRKKVSPSALIVTVWLRELGRTNQPQNVSEQARSYMHRSPI